jgi:hypothetical protein
LDTLIISGDLKTQPRTQAIVKMSALQAEDLEKEQTPESYALDQTAKLPGVAGSLGIEQLPLASIFKICLQFL